MATYRTPSGRVLTDADIEALADEAERGYSVDHLVGKPSGDPVALRERFWISNPTAAQGPDREAGG